MVMNFDCRYTIKGHSWGDKGKENSISYKLLSLMKNLGRITGLAKNPQGRIQENWTSIFSFKRLLQTTQHSTENVKLSTYEQVRINDVQSNRTARSLRRSNTETKICIKFRKKNYRKKLSICLGLHLRSSGSLAVDNLVYLKKTAQGTKILPCVDISR